MNNFSINQVQANTSKHHKKARHFIKDRRSKWNLMALFQSEDVTKGVMYNPKDSNGLEYKSGSIIEKRTDVDRRKVVNTKFLNCGKCIDRRKNIRRSNDRIDEEAVEREKFRRLGPGWL